MARFGADLSFRFFLAFFLAFLFLAQVPRMQAQSVLSTGNIPTPESLLPVPGVGHDYVHLLSETVNPANGSVSFNFQFPLPKSRGISLPYSLLSTSPGAYILGENDEGQVAFRFIGGPSTRPGVTWTESTYKPPDVQCGICVPPPPFALCQFATNFTFIDASGRSHTLPMGVEAPNVNQAGNDHTQWCGSGNTVPSGTEMIGDGKVVGMFTDQATSISNVSQWNVCTSCAPQSVAGPIGPFVIEDDQGDTYFFSGECGFNSFLEVCQESPDKIEDRNGNMITDENIDTLGRHLGGNASDGNITIGGIEYCV